MHRLVSISASLMLGLAGCGGSGSSGDTLPPPIPITKAEAFQFLNQTTFGALESEANRVIAMRHEAWIDDQMMKPASLNLPFLRLLPIVQPLGLMNADRVDIWFRNALDGDDQL